MPLLRALNTIPLWTLIVGLLAVCELYSVGLMLLSRPKWGIDRLKLNNEVAGFKFSVIGVLYAVLLAFLPSFAKNVFQVDGIGGSGRAQANNLPGAAHNKGLKGYLREGVGFGRRPFLQEPKRRFGVVPTARRRSTAEGDFP